MVDFDVHLLAVLRELAERGSVTAVAEVPSEDAPREPAESGEGPGDQSGDEPPVAP